MSTCQSNASQMISAPVAIYNLELAACSVMFKVVVDSYVVPIFTRNFTYRFFNDAMHKTEIYLTAARNYSSTSIHPVKTHHRALPEYP
jgi:uncharacterized protein YqkB